MNLDQIEQDLVWARDNADRSAQTRLYVHHVPQMLTALRALEVEVEEVGEDEPQDFSNDPVTPDDPQGEESSEEPAQPDASVTGESGEAEGENPVAESESIFADED